MLVYIYCQLKPSFGINEIGSIANSMIAILTLILAFYIFVYQRNKDKKDLIVQKEKDKKDEVKTLLIQKQNIKLQWFKNIIIEPKIEKVFLFYDNIRALKNKINSNELSEDDKMCLLQYIKKEHSVFRKSFLELLRFISPNLFATLYQNINKLIDGLIDVISDDELKLNNLKTYEREITTRIQGSYDNFLTQIFNYNGEEIVEKVSP